MMRWLSAVFSVVENTCTSSIFPSMPAPLIMSPALNGRKTMMRKPAAKFDSPPLPIPPLESAPCSNPLGKNP